MYHSTGHLWINYRDAVSKAIGRLSTTFIVPHRYLLMNYAEVFPPALSKIICAGLAAGRFRGRGAKGLGESNPRLPCSSPAHYQLSQPAPWLRLGSLHSVLATPHPNLAWPPPTFPRSRSLTKPGRPLLCLAAPRLRLAAHRLRLATSRLRLAAHRLRLASPNPS
jgi:hypothetical protein